MFDPFEILAVQEKLLRFACVALVFLALLSAVSKSSFAQTTLPGDAVARHPSISVVSDEDKRYLIGVGDVLDVRVFNRPELSRETVRVDERGMIRIPLIEKEIRASCRTETELANEIASRYVEYIRTPHVEVFVKDFRSQFVAVLGAVRDPGRFQLQRRVKLLELLSFAGGPTEQAGGRVHVKHAPGIEKCEAETPRQSDVAADALQETSDELSDWYELDKLLRGDTADSDNPYIRPGDIVHLVEADKVYVVGNVFKPAIIPLKTAVTLTQAIAMAGGTLPDTNFDRVRIVRKSQGQISTTEIIVDLKAINKNRAKDEVLQPNDIVEVPSSSGKRFIHGLLNSVAPNLSRLPIRVIP